MRKSRCLLISLLLIVIVSACEKRQPIPIGGPPVGGQIHGLPEGVFARISFRSLPIDKTEIWSEQKNGGWKVVIPSASEKFLVTAEAADYQSAPPSYIIQVKDKKAYIELDGQTTSQKAIHLDFTFSSK
jgi:hypothetical protein